MKVRLTDRKLQSFKPQKNAQGKLKQYDVGDTDTPGMCVRVGRSGTKTFVVRGRFPGSENPTRRRLGDYPALSLADAREKARDWRKLLDQGKDPSIEEEKRRRAELRNHANTFGSVAEEYFADIKRRKLRRSHEVERDVRREFVTRWEKRPITDIGRDDVLAVVEAAIKRGSPWQAHHVFSYCSRIFSWALERGVYGLEVSPTANMRPARLIGAKSPRTRVLSDAEIRAVWKASDEYPLGPLLKILLLTGQRRSEVAEAQWSEFDFDKRLWTIPATRMKAGAAHVVPLTKEVIAILESLPRFKGPYVFTTTLGVKAVNGFSKAKARLDKAMPKIEPWVIHDLRRTMRTGLSSLPVPDLVRELVISHSRPGLHKVYDQHAYLDEKRHALELWAARLREIVTPPPANVVRMRGRR
jgi:integrase